VRKPFEKSTGSTGPRGKMKNYKAKDKQAEVRLERIKKMIKIYVQAKLLFKQRYALLQHAKKARWTLYEALTDEIEYCVKHYGLTVYSIMSLVGMEYRNILYPIRRRIEKKKKGLPHDSHLDKYNRADTSHLRVPVDETKTIKEGK
jgi:hypothetical protein